MPRLIKLFFVLLLSAPVFSQVRILQIDNQYILVDQRSGKYATPEKFDRATRLREGYDWILLKKNGKYGYFSGGTLQLACEYDGISEVIHGQDLIGLAVSKGGAYAFMTTSGKLYTDFLYSGISAFKEEMHDNGPNVKQMILLKKGEQINFGYNDYTSLTMVLPDFVDHIEYNDNLWVLKKGSRQTVVIVNKYDVIERKVKYEHPFETCRIMVTPEYYYRIFEGKKIEEYPRSGEIVKKTLPYTRKNLDMIDDQLGIPMLQDSGYERGSLFSGEDMREPARMERSLSKLKSSGKWKDVTMVGYYNQLSDNYSFGGCWPQYEGQLSDTVIDKKPAVRVKYPKHLTRLFPDTILTGYDALTYDKTRKSNMLIAVQKKKAQGVIDLRGYTVLKPEWKKITIASFRAAQELIIAENKKASYLFVYNPVKQTLDTLMKGLPGDQYYVDGTHILLRHFSGKKMVHSEYRSLYTMDNSSPCDKVGRKDIAFTNDSVRKHALLPHFVEVFDNGKTGIYNYKTEQIIPVDYENIRLDFCFETDPEVVRPSSRFKVIKPYMICTNGPLTDVYTIHRKDFKIEFAKSKPIETKGKALNMSDDGLFLVQMIDTDKADLYLPNGEKLSGETFSGLNNSSVAQFDESFWYIEAKDINGKPVAVTQNGTVFHLPE